MQCIVGPKAYAGLGGNPDGVDNSVIATGDQAPTEIEDRQPNFSGSRDNIEFDRVQFAIFESSDPWTFDKLMVAATLDDLAAAEQTIGNEE